MWWRPDKGGYEVKRLANAEQASLRGRPPAISGLQVSAVEECTCCLGVVVTRDLDFKATVSGRCKC